MISSRIGRLEYLFWCGAPVVVGSIVLMIVALVSGSTDVSLVGTPVQRPLGLVVLACSVAILRAGVTRLHDVGWSGWGVLLLLVPLVDIFAFLLLLLVPGQKTRNVFGDPPIFLQRPRRLA
ncbi:MAG TPA: DUF805 domain-containing protein [Chthoniobacterales bacterium]|jgi:uncharacterized membrane protein YhaH (DUF805 family)|nr:DUF805 domain-containing protein [Chthoniobacterales bacterium]